MRYYMLYYSMLHYYQLYTHYYGCALQSFVRKKVYSIVLIFARFLLSAAPACPPSVISWYKMVSLAFASSLAILCAFSTNRLACDGWTRSSAVLHVNSVGGIFATERSEI